MAFDGVGGPRQQFFFQGEGGFTYGITLNEPVPGAITGAIRDLVPNDLATVAFESTDVLVVLDDQNYADGSRWRYVLYEYEAGSPSTVTLAVTNEDGSGSSATVEVPAGFAPTADVPRPWNMFLGELEFGGGIGKRALNGQMDEFQFTRGALADGDRLGVLPASAAAPTAIEQAADAPFVRWSYEDEGQEGLVISLDEVSLDTQLAANILVRFAGNGITRSSDVPPAGLLNAGVDAGVSSYDPGAALAFPGDGASLHAADIYDTAFEFEGPFAVETFFKTSTAETGRMTILMQGERLVLAQGGTFERFDLAMNNSAAGDVAFTVTDGAGTVLTAEANGQDCRDGEWHYVRAVFDGSEVSVTVSSLGDGSVVADTASVAVPGGFALGASADPDGKNDILDVLGPLSAFDPADPNRTGS